MAEYIEREAAIDAIMKVYVRTAGYKARERVFEAEEAVHRLPVADVAPVVRCKDCVHARKKNDYEGAYLCDEVLICTSCEASEDGWLPVWPQHFCSDGRPREEHDAEPEE